MMLEQDHCRELDDLLNALCEETITPEQASRLESIVQSSRRARDRYLAYMSLDAELHWELAAATPGGCPGNLPLPLGEGRGEGSWADDPTSLPLPLGEGRGEGSCEEGTSQSPILGFLGDIGKQGIDLSSKPTRFSMLVAAAVIGSLLTLLAIWAAPLYRKGNRPQPGPTPPPDYVARLTRTVDCQWKEIRTAPVRGAHLRVGQQLALDGGLVEIVFDSGAKVILEGPGVLAIVSTTAARLERGKLVAMVSDAASGFTIRTPDALLRDLGTEFGVEIDRSGRTSLCVFQGAVSVETPDAPNIPSTIVSAGQAVRVETALGTAVLAAPARPGHFVRNLPKPVVSRADGRAMLATIFDDGLEGWNKKPLSKTYLLSQRPTGGNPGGLLLSTGNCPGTQLIAPAAYRGDLSRFDGGTISFDAKYVQPGNNGRRAGGFDFGLIKITGGGRTVKRRIADSPPTARWKTFRGPFTAAAFRVSQSDWENIIGNVTSLTINLNAFNGVPNEILAFDNIVLLGQDTR